MNRYKVATLFCLYEMNCVESSNIIDVELPITVEKVKAKLTIPGLRHSLRLKQVTELATREVETE